MRANRSRNSCPLAGVRGPRPLDVLLVAPGDDRCPLDELLWRGADVRPELLQRRDELRVAGDEAGAVARHRGALRERVEHGHVRPVGELEGRDGRLVEPELGVRLVRGEHEVVLAGERCESLVERERRRCSRGVVRVVDPHECGSLPGLGGQPRRGPGGSRCASSSGSSSTRAPANWAPRTPTG